MVKAIEQNIRTFTQSRKMLVQFLANILFGVED